MKETTDLVRDAQAGSLDAYGDLVGRFQDMVYGYAYAILNDFHAAEDVAQESFVAAYQALGQLRNPAAFSGWLRRVVHKHADRHTRARQVGTVPLLAAADHAAKTPGPLARAEKGEMRSRVRSAIAELPEAERMATTLFYINGYSQKEVAGFLEVPVSTVNARLQAARGRLKERMMNMVSEEMKGRPLSDGFPARVRAVLERPRLLEVEGHPVRAVWEAVRQAFDDFDVIDLDEVCSADVRGVPGYEHTFDIDENHVLRVDLTGPILDKWLREGGARKWLAVGRVFRDEENEEGTRLAVFHQLEVFLSGQGVGEADLCEQFLRAARAIFGESIECRLKPAEWVDDATVSHGTELETKWRDEWLEVGGGGVFTENVLKQGGEKTAGLSAVGFAFGLERCAQILHDLDTVGQLWKPPFVAG